ncbi:exportin-7-B, putative, partial [Entamoeba invadens IP1]
RISFSNSSPNSVLLFRGVVNAMSNIITLLPVLPKPYADKAIEKVYGIYNNLLTGSYVPYGVLIFYNDPALNNMVETSVKLVCMRNNDEILTDPKLRSIIFVMLNGLFTTLHKFVFKLSNEPFQKFLSLLIAGLKMTDNNVVRTCITIITIIFELVDNIQARETEDMNDYQRKMEDFSETFKMMTKASLDAYLFSSIQGRAIGCLASLMKRYRYFDEYAQQYLIAQKNEVQTQLIIKSFQTIKNAVENPQFPDILSKTLNEMRGNIDSD